MAHSRLSISEVAERIGVSTKTLIRWEKTGRIKNVKRDFRGWRVYSEVELHSLEEMVNQLF